MQPAKSGTCAEALMRRAVRRRPGQVRSGRLRYRNICATEPPRARLVQTAGCPSEHIPGPLATTRNVRLRNLPQKGKIRGAALVDTHRQARCVVSRGHENSHAALYRALPVMRASVAITNAMELFGRVVREPALVADVRDASSPRAGGRRRGHGTDQQPSACLCRAVVAMGQFHKSC